MSKSRDIRNHNKKMKELFIEEYIKAPIKIKECGEKFGLSIYQCNQILKAKGIRHWSQQEIFNKDMNEHYFDNIDTEEKAYFLGWFHSDWIIFHHKPKSCKNNLYKLSLGLNSDDSYMIQNFLNAINSTYKIHHRKRKISICGSEEKEYYESSVNINSKLLYDGLQKWGTEEHKHHSIAYIKPELFRHYVRGLFDGDGWYSLNDSDPSRNRKPCWNFCSPNKDFIKELVNILPFKHSGLKYSKDNVVRVRWSTEDTARITHWLYDDANIYLIRKKNKIDNTETT